MEDKLSKCLAGFRKSHGTQYLLVTMLEKWGKKRADKAECVSALFLDLPRTFHLINQDLLLNAIQLTHIVTYRNYEIVFYASFVRIHYFVQYGFIEVCIFYLFFQKTSFLSFFLLLNLIWFQFLKTFDNICVIIVYITKLHNCNPLSYRNETPPETSLGCFSWAN